MTAVEPDDSAITWELAPHVARVETSGQVYVLALDRTEEFGEPLAITGTGHYLWTLLGEESTTTAQVVECVCRDFPEVDPDTARADVVDFLESLARRGVLLRRG